MPQDDESYVDLLRAVGQLLDTEGALRARVLDNGSQIIVSWLRGGSDWERQVYPRGAALDGLIETAAQRRDARTREDGAPGLGWEEQLRTLGQELQREGLLLVEISQHEGIHVLGTADGVAVDHVYSLDEIQQLSRNRRALRKPTPPSPGGWWRRFFSGPRG